METPVTRGSMAADAPEPPEVISAPLVLAVLRVPAHRDWNDAHATHKRVAAATTGARPLWAMPAPGLLLVQAETVDTDLLAAGGGTVTGLVDLAAALGRLAEGTRVRFSLIGNPCRVERVTPDRQLACTPRRVPLPHAERPAWLHRKVAGALAVTSLEDRPLRSASGVRRGGRVLLARHMFTGVATVTDPAALAALARAGVGPGKGYGCGLLTVREAP